MNIRLPILQPESDPPASREWVYPDPEDPSVAIDRRQFLALAGASAALAGGFGCSPTPAPQDEIVPYVTPPEGITPGLPLTFATTMSLGGAGIGLLVTSREGRPVKVEGNPDHPGSLGATDLLSQAVLLGLYDPDRSKSVTHRGAPSTWEAATTAIKADLGPVRQKRGVGLRILSGAITSPTLASQRASMREKFPEARWITYEPAAGDSAVRGAEFALGEPARPVYDFSRADVVLSLDSDFLAGEPGTVRYQHDYADRRRVRSGGQGGVSPGAMNRLYAVESTVSTTGANADHRLAVKPSEVALVARALATELKVPGAPASPDLTDSGKAWIVPLAADLLAHKGRSLVLAGDGQPAAVHALCFAINAHLGNTGSTIRFVEPFGVDDGIPGLRSLVAEMEAGQVSWLLIVGSNPAYTAPADLRFVEALRSVKTSVHLGLHEDETARACQWHMPEAHLMEAWGDSLAYDGTAAIQQPLIVPLYGGRSAIEVVAMAIDEGTPRGLDLVRDYWRNSSPQAGSSWSASVQKGVIADTARPAKTVAMADDWASKLPDVPSSSAMEIQFRADPVLHDGRFANNGWLQELPRPITKLTWGNAAIVGPSTAKRLGIAMNVETPGGQHGHLQTDEVVVTYRGRSITIPAFVLPGQAEDVVTIHLGHGRTRAGRVGTGVGVSAYELRTYDSPWFGPDVEVRRTGHRVGLACTQAHHQMQGREPVRRGTAVGFARDPSSLTPPEDLSMRKAAVTALSDEQPPAPPQIRDPRLDPPSLYPEWPYEGRRWAMAIDLSTCTGCSACVVACQSENNIPVVGPKQVLLGRELHWLRIDEYQDGDQRYTQPVPCMHCEKAPCEVVCPVGATVHSSDGLNDMIYNRCVGTRYCSNNCPYKVRRFNFLDYADYADESMKPLRNPEVTVRSRGVMEKCTYCVQRIRGAEHEAVVDGRPIPDGAVKTACQQACPSQAIHFGDWNDPGSTIRAWKSQPHNYGLLEELNTQPRTSYLAAVRNPNPAMPEGS